MREEGEKKGEGGGTKKRLLNLQIGHLEMTAISAGMQRSRNMCPPAMRVHPPVPPHLQCRLMLLMGEHTSIHWDIPRIFMRWSCMEAVGCLSDTGQSQVHRSQFSMRTFVPIVLSLGDK